MAKEKLNRRQILKASGAVSAVSGSAGLGFFGYEDGKSPETHTGYEILEGAGRPSTARPMKSIVPIIGRPAKVDHRLSV
jgi:hypothetical protein